MDRLKVIVQNGFQLLESPAGEKIPRLTRTVITQGIDKTNATCQFSALVNLSPDSLLYDNDSGILSMPSGEILTVTIFKNTTLTNGIQEISALALIELPYETQPAKSIQPVQSN